MTSYRLGLVLLAAVSVPFCAPAQDVHDGQIPVAPGKEAARTPVAQKPGQQPGNSWFPVTDLDLGTFFGEGEASGSFQWKNPTDQAIEWRNLSGSCQCIRAVIRVEDRIYHLKPKQATPLVRVTRDANGREITEPVGAIAIGPKETGEVEVHLDMHGITGPKMATLDVHTTDAVLPQFKLKWNAVGAQLFAISPAEVQLNKMVWSESRDFTVTVTSPLKRDFNITGMDPVEKSFDVKWEKTMNGDLAVWTITGRYGPVGEDTAGGGVLKFRTDVNGMSTFTVRVMAFVQGPLEVKPGGFLTLGMIRQGSSLHKEVVFEPNDGSDLQMTGYHFERLRGNEQWLKVTSNKDGNKLVVDFAVLEGAPSGLVKGDLVVELNHPLVKEKRIMFNGYVR